MPADLRELTRQWFEQVWNQGRAEAIDELFAPNGIAHGLGPGGSDLRGTEGFKLFHAAYLQAFPDLHIRIEEVIVEGDLAAARITGTGTHRGDGLGVAATGRPVSFTGMTFTRWREGKIVEGWNNVDLTAIERQIAG